MAVQLQLRRGTTEENDAFTGAVAEVTVDTEAHELRVHDGFTQGGFAVPKKSDVQPKSKSTVTGTHNYISEGNEVASNLIALDTQVKSLSTSKADSATTLAGYGITDGTNTNLSNLTSTGANIANWSSNVTNYITSIPQDIKLELNNGTLILKSGSKVYVPNGDGVFDTVTTTQDLSITISGDGQKFIYKNPGNYINYQAITTSVSGTTDSLSGTPWHLWYDKTNNVINRYGADGTTAMPGQSLPIAVVTVSGGAISSIDQIFNGFGFVGSTVFALPGVKGLIPNGFNADGTLKNIFAVNSSVHTYTASSAFDAVIGMNTSGEISCYSNLVYNKDTNMNYHSGSPYGRVNSGNVIFGTGGQITSFNPKTPFHAVDYNDFADLKSDTYTKSEVDTITSGKADTNLNNVSAGIDFVVESQLPTAQNNYTWYRKYKSGWVEQGGYVTTSSDVEKTVSLPVQMDNVYYDVQIQREYTSSPGSTNANLTAMCVWGLTTTEFKCWDKYGTSIGIHWEVKGKAA